MKVGFTGTREGMTDEQSASVWALVRALYPSAAHHGDCIGADEQFHGLVFEACGLDCRRVGHPSTLEWLRAWCECDETRDPVTPLLRNRHIVDETDVLIAAPKQMREPEDPKEGGGTWSTVRYARRLGKRIYTVRPDGQIVSENVKEEAA